MRRPLRYCAGKVLLAILLFVSMAMLSVWGVTTGAENKARSVAFAFTGKTASGQLHIVEIDAASIAEIKNWPWPRDHYARVVDQLHEAGVRSITFDVDFSSPYGSEQDAEFAAALARADGLVALPTFSQRANHAGAHHIDALPIAQLREHVSLASVSVAPDSDGLVRGMLLGTITQGTPRPSLAAHIARRSGSVGTSFPIDFGINPDTIPRHSFVGIENGRFDPAKLFDKDIIIGATAVELGDDHVVPRYGVVPGVVVQALAAETLFKGVPTVSGWFIPLFLGCMFAIWIMCPRSIASTSLRGLAAFSSILVITWLSWSMAQLMLEIMPALGAIVGATVLHLLFLVRQQRLAKSLIDAESGLPNQGAMERDQAGQSPAFTIAAMIGGYDALKSVLTDEQMGTLVSRIAERLAAASGGAAIYRFDHRVLVWTSNLNPSDLENCLSGLNAIMRSPIEVAARRIDINLGLGIADQGSPAEASFAALRALRDGDKWRFHKDSESAALKEDMSLLGELDAAISTKALQVHYQPKLKLAGSTISSVEALVRWTHPVRGPLGPDAFIPLAEESGRISDLTIYVLKQAIADLRAWNDQGITLSAAVNISARLVTSDSFIAAVMEILAKTDLPPQQLIFEVTETASLGDQAAAGAALRRLRELGVAISMDDYGTGQSSLSYLKTLPLSELKIDRSFVQFAYRDEADALVVRSTVNLAHQLGLSVVAEGVEDLECLSFLREIGCDYAQGYFVSRPLLASAVADFVRTGLADKDQTAQAAQAA